jgi:acetyl-CoA carboxylase biotin carboxylase subunit
MDFVYSLDGSSSIDTYLNIKKISEIIEKSGCDFVHPGYGFLSENHIFAEEVLKKRVKFVGPSPESMRLMGDKVEAKKLAKRARVPTVPGTDDALLDPNEAFEKAKNIGFPVILKAKMGGGGKGMRIVRKEKEFISSFKLASQEAQNAFGDGSIYIEKFIEKPRHVEVQIIGDKYGNYYALGERECSIQRRHQKLIEESPSPFITQETRKKMSECAIALVKECKYENAGTVEFIVDEEGNFYFMEMNTRLQVEHPVTEMRFGIDLVALQMRVAQGERLKLDDLKPRGYSIEVRVYAEDPFNNFIPFPGEIKWLVVPSGPFVRIDNGVYQGYRVPEEYDPLLLKVITWGMDRKEGIERMKRALEELWIAGIITTKNYTLALIKEDFFFKGEYDTYLLSRYTPKLDKVPEFIEKEVIFDYEKESLKSLKRKREGISEWKSFKFFYNNFEDF